MSAVRCRLCGESLLEYRGAWFGKGDSVRCLTGPDVRHEPLLAETSSSLAERYVDTLNRLLGARWVPSAAATPGRLAFTSGSKRVELPNIPDIIHRETAQRLLDAADAALKET